MHLGIFERDLGEERERESQLLGGALQWDAVHEILHPSVVGHASHDRASHFELDEPLGVQLIPAELRLAQPHEGFLASQQGVDALDGLEVRIEIDAPLLFEDFVAPDVRPLRVGRAAGQVLGMPAFMVGAVRRKAL